MRAVPEGQGRRDAASAGRRIAVLEPMAILMIFLAVSGLINTWRVGQVYPGIDYYHFWLVPQIVAAGESSDPYAPAEARRLGQIHLNRSEYRPDDKRLQSDARARPILEISGTPFLYAVFRPFVSFEYDKDYSRFEFVSLLALAFGTVCCVRLVGGSWKTAGAVLALVAWTFEPLRADVRVGNLNQIQLALFALYLLLCKYGNRFPLEELAGFTLGLAVMLKPNVVGVAIAMFAAFVIDRRFDRLRRQILGFILAAAVSVAVSILFFGSASVWTSWLLNLAVIVNRMSVDAGNVGLSRLMKETAGASIVWLLLLVVPCVFGLVVWRSRRPRPTPAGAIDASQFDRDYLVASVANAAALLCLSVAWLHYFLLLVPLWVRLLCGTQADRSTNWGTIRIVCVSLSLVFLCSWPHPAIVASGLSIQRAVECSIAAALLFSCGLIEIKKGLARKSGVVAAVDLPEPLAV